MWAFFLISSRSDSYLNLWIYGQNSTDSWRTTRYDDGQSPRNKASKDTKVSVSLFSADISKSEEISRWRPIDKTVHYDFSATETFFISLLKTAHPQKLAFRKQCPKNIKIEYSQRFACNTQTDRQTDYYNPLPTRSG